MQLRFLVFASLVLAGPASVYGQRSDVGRPGSKDIVITLRNAGNFNLFLQAVENAGMTAQLKGTGPLTVFAPTDDAFGRLPGSLRDSLLRDRPALETLIRNHVAEGRLTAAEARKGARGMSFLGGAAIRVDTSGPHERVNGAQIIKVDMAASNGIIHVIDRVWMPPRSQP